MEIDLSQIDVMQILWIVGLLIVGWVVLRFVLKLAAKIFACGCSVIVLIAGLLVLWQLFGQG